MINLIRAHLYRVLHDKTMWVVCICFFLYAIIAGIVFIEINAYSLGHGGSYILGSSLSTISALSFSAFPAILCPFFIPAFIGREWKSGTFRNQTVSGFSRLQMFFGMFITLFAVTTIALLVCFGLLWVILLIGQTPFAAVAGTMSGKQYFLSFFLLLLELFMVDAVATFFSFVCRSSLGGLFATLGFFFILGIVVSLTELFQSINRGSYYQFLEFLPTYQLNHLTNLSLDLATDYLGEVIPGRELAFSLKTVLVTVVISAASLVGGAFIFTKNDLR